MDESPRWLAVRGDHDRAVKILQKAGKWNKVPLPPEDEVKALMRQEVSRMLFVFVLFCVCVCEGGGLGVCGGFGGGAQRVLSAISKLP